MALCFIFLLMLLHTHLSLHSTLSIRKLQDSELATLKLNDKSLMEDSGSRRLELHEVHSGPNPISNSFTEEPEKVAGVEPWGFTSSFFSTMSIVLDYWIRFMQKRLFHVVKKIMHQRWLSTCPVSIAATIIAVGETYEEHDNDRESYPVIVMFLCKKFKGDDTNGVLSSIQSDDVYPVNAYRVSIWADGP